MAEDSFSKFKKRYKEGKISTTQMPPLPAGPSSVGRMLVQGAAQLAGPSIRAAIGKAVKGKGVKPAGKGRIGTMADRLAGTRTRPRTEKESNKFGPLVKRKDNLPVKRGSNAVVKREENMPAVVREGKKDLQKYNPGKRSLAAQGPRTFGDKGQAGRVAGLSNKGKLALGAGAAGAAAAGYAGYNKADKATADEGKKPNNFARTGPIANAKRTMKNMPIVLKGLQEEARRPQTPTSSVGGTKNGPFKSDFAKKSLQGRNPTKIASDKSRVSGKTKPSSATGTPGKMSAFERQKARMYEKEGYGGRSMTSSQAKARVQNERSYKFKDLFK